MNIEKKLNTMWYSKTLAYSSMKCWSLLTTPFSVVYKTLSNQRKIKALQSPEYLKASQEITVPVIVVGNIHIGGMGKSPAVDGLVEVFQSFNLKIGVLLRGYGAEQSHTSIHVTPSSSLKKVGDEALMHVLLGADHVVVDHNRSRGAQYLCQLGVDIIICDDGLQHYALPRDYEIAMVQLDRGFGNQQLLPKGPLREPIQRLQDVDLILSQSQDSLEQRHLDFQQAHGLHTQWHLCSGVYKEALNLSTRRLEDLSSLKLPTHKKLHAIAGVAHPQSFFQYLASQNICCSTHEFPDHYHYQPQDLIEYEWLFMTMKDAVKCFAFTKPHWYAIPYKLKFDQTLAKEILTVAQTACAARKAA